MERCCGCQINNGLADQCAMHSININIYGIGLMFVEGKLISGFTD